MRKPNQKRYFTQETQDAIVLYNSSVDPIERSKIYGEQIHYAFFKLTQNIIHTFKLIQILFMFMINVNHNYL